MSLKNKFSLDNLKPDFKPNFKLKLEKPKIDFSFKWIVISFIAMLIIIGGGIFYLNYDFLTPEEAVNQALSQTLNAESYRYKALSKRILDGEEELLSEAQGEKNKGNVHFISKLFLVNSEFEYYQIGEKIYRKDPFSANWLVVDEMGMAVTEQLIQEINPLGAFQFQEIVEVEYLGKEEIEDKKYKKYIVQATTENKYLTGLWQNFTYTIWTDTSKERMMKKAEIIAQSKRAPEQYLIMSIEFTDYNQEIVIDLPV